MRRNEKQTVLNKANILAEQRYLQTKGLIKESEPEYLGGEMLNDFLNNLSPEDKNTLKAIVWEWFKWDPSRISNFQKNEGNLRFVSKGKNGVSFDSMLEIGGKTYRINGFTMDNIRTYLLANEKQMNQPQL